MRIRRARYLKHGKPITLAFVKCVADQHPEAAATAYAQPPAPEPPKFNPERRVPRLITKFTAKDRILYERAIRRFLRHHG
jgi:hypothetical protein